jgi:hypothetical protein
LLTFSTHICVSVCDKKKFTITFARYPFQKHIIVFFFRRNLIPTRAHHTQVLVYKYSTLCKNKKIWSVSYNKYKAACQKNYFTLLIDVIYIFFFNQPPVNSCKYREHKREFFENDLTLYKTK